MTEKSLTSAGGASLATEKDLKAYEAKILSQQNQRFPARYNTIKIWYDSEANPEHVGKYIAFKSGETEPTLIGDKFEGIILARRHQYSNWDDDQTRRMRTNQFEEWNEMVTVRFNGLKDQVKPVNKWVKENYPDATYSVMLYVLYNKEVYVVRVKGASCGPWFDHLKAIDPKKTLFSHVTEFGHSKDKMGNVTFYPMSFKESEKELPEKYPELLKKSFEVAKWIEALNNPEEDSGTYDPDKAKKEAEEIFNS